MRKNIFNLNLNIFKKYLDKIKEKNFFALNILINIYKKNIIYINNMKNISYYLKKKLNLSFYILLPKIIFFKISFDNTIKWFLKLYNKYVIETICIPKKKKNTLCLSSQIGCNIKCIFCYTGKNKFYRNLNINELIGQFLIIKIELYKKYYLYKNINIYIKNIVFMGMGEPLLNFKNIIFFLKFLLYKKIYNFSKRNIIISTSGISPKIKKLSLICPISLSISLHSSNNKLRNFLIPLNKKYNLYNLLKSCKKYIKYSPKKNITFEYCMIKNINDFNKNAKELINLLINNISKNKKKFKLNLIPFNNFEKSNFKTSNIKQIKNFFLIIKKSGIFVTIRKKRGNDIYAACGQLNGILNKYKYEKYK